MTGVNADLEALEALHRAVVLEFKDCPTWKPVLKEARRALNVLWQEFYEFQREMQIYEEAFQVNRNLESKRTKVTA